MILFVDEYMTASKMKHTGIPLIDDANKAEIDKCQRFGLSPFKIDHLYQYIFYLKGL